LMDMPASEWRRRLLDRLREIDPTHLLLTTSAAPADDAAAVAALEQLDYALADASADSILLLHRARQIAYDPAHARQVAELLIGSADRFQHNPLVQLQFEIAVLELLQDAGAEADAAAWLARISSPAPYQHMRPLCHVVFYLPRDIDTARVWLNEAIAVAPDQPEVLLAAITVLGQTNEHQAAINAADRLFALLRTRQTAILRLRVLRDGRRFQDVLNLLEQTADIALPEGEQRSYRATALVALGQPLRALLDLEWLAQHGEANVHGLITLAQLYLQLHRHVDAVTILRRCIAEYADEPGGYLMLSQTLLARGQPDESFRVAIQARERLPDDPHVALHLVQLAFPAGHEQNPAAREALTALLPGGPLAAAELATQADVEAARAIVIVQMQATQEADRLYVQGQISLLMRCYMLQMQLSWYHALVQRRLAVQLVAPQFTLKPSAWRDAPRLTAVIFDYTALLTAWALFGDSLLSIVRASIDTIYVPASLLAALDWEQAALAARGQRALDEARAAVAVAITRQPQRLHLHALPDTDGATPNPITAAATMSARAGLVYVTAYTAPERPLNVPAIDLPALADTLLRAGEIVPNEARTLREERGRDAVEHGTPALPRGTDIATNTLTLVAIAQAGALDGLLRYIGALHLLEQDWEELRAEVAGVELREHAIRDLDRLRTLLLRGIEDGLLHAESLAPDQHLLESYTAFEHEQANTLPALRQLALRYTDELISLAHHHHALLWTDDRWTNRVGLPEHVAIERVGTETMLDWLHRCGALDEQRVYDAHAALISWGYQGLTINAGYLHWLVRQGVAPDARSLADAATRYRAALLALWTSAGPETTFGQQTYLVYLQRTAESVLGCFADHAAAEVVATIVRDLDISHDWPALEGNEPTHLSDVLMRIVGLIYRGAPITAPALQQLTTFSGWLEAALQQASFPKEAIDEAWRITVDRILQLYGELAAKHGQPVTGDRFLKLVIRIMPERALDIVLASRLGARVRAYVGDMLRAEIVWAIRQPNGATERLTYPHDEWQRDYERAVDRAVTQVENAPITVGVITIQTARATPSLLLRFHLAPTALHAERSSEAIVQTDDYVALFPRFADHRRTQRQAVWQIGRQQLTALGLSTQAWEQLRPKLLANNANAWRPAGRQALRTLLGHWPLVRTYLSDAVALDQSALFEVLARLDSDDGRSWLGLGSRERIDAAALSHWAERTAATVTLDGDMTDAGARLSAYLGRFGHSLFLDAPIVRERMVTLIMGCPRADGQAALLQHLAHLGQATASVALKANCVLIILRCHAHADWEHDADNSLRDELAQLIVQIARSQTPDDPQTVYPRLIAALTAYLYQSWQSSAHVDATGRAYLAHMAASWIGEELAVHLPPAVAEQLIDALTPDPHDELHASAPPRQPYTLFRPAWASLLNYGAALVLAAPAPIRPALATLLATPPARSAMLFCGAQHRVLQEVLNVATVQPGWLDGPRVADIPQAIATLFAEQDQAALAAWPEAEQYALVMCRVPEAGALLLANAIHRLPQAPDDGEVLNTVAMVLLGLDSPGGSRAALVTDLLALEPLARIQQCSGCHAVLLWRLTAVLMRPDRYDAALVDAAQAALRAIPPDMPVAADVAARIAGVLAHRATAGQLVDTLRVWVEHLGLTDAVPLAAARAALRMLVQWWPSLAMGTRALIRPSLDALAEMPRFSRLWELRRLRESD
jgi:hypothetical protein